MLAQIMLPDTRIGLPGEPIAQNTRFGWILSGRAEGVREATQLRCHRVLLDTEALLKRFCEVESVPDRPIATEGDLWCESFFQETHVRRPDGRYVVRLPFKTYLDPTMVLGKSHQMALNRFLQMERRLSNNPDRWSKYVDEIEEYFALEQIAPAMGSESSTVRSTAANRHVASCVLPHHAVFKKEIQSTKQRIVFDASSRTSNGRSLNDILWTGPTLQNDMSAVILNWRKYRFVFTADIQKMYRCIDVHPEDAQYQRILWRAAEGSINVYALATLTFGTASAPFMAIRVIQQLAKDERCSFPKAEEVLRDEIYVDDILSGGHTIEDAEDKRAQVSGAIKSACMELRKWSSNEESILQSIPPEHQCSRTPLNWDAADPIKALGMYWLPNKDCFKFQVNFEIPPTFTKRTILSSIARLFDPLGLIAPVIISGKLILKEVTMAKKTQDNGARTALDWDDEVPKALAERWQAFRDGLLGIDCLSIQRWIHYSPGSIVSAQLHAFCDGSSTSYAATTYLRLEHGNGACYVSLLAAKSKVTPTKPLTIPRTELSGAVLAVKLVKWLTSARWLNDLPIQTFYWTDATILLHWLHGDVNRWKTFVANRVAFILDHSSPSQWRHVGTSENPADCATRGLPPSELKDFDLWWRGPEWLTRKQDDWPSTEIGQVDIHDAALEAKADKVRVHLAVPQPSLVERFSSFSQAIRVTAFIIRFKSNAISKGERYTGPLSIKELDYALLAIVRIVQRESFSSELAALMNSKRLPSKSKLQKLVIRYSHTLTLHGGAQLTLAHARQRFWILTGRQAVRRVLRKCVRCFRTRPTTSAQLMGDLPLHRVNPPNRPFLATGVDYTGAIELKAARLRGASFYKGYIAVFICLATKAVHLEAVTGLTTEHFLLALDRFTGRRGMVQHLYSDNGTNFIGADNLMKALFGRLQEDYEKLIAPKLAAQRATWHFNPPQSPNFGGLWEANVKSVKHHLKRVIADRRLTYEELSTVLISIEACLNSRPLCPLTADADDLEVLTPAHFLIGDSMLAPPEYRPQSKSFAEQFLIQQSMIRHFWKAWSRDWLAHLQERPKWCHEAEGLQLNDLVIIKDDRFPPSQWLFCPAYYPQDGLDTRRCLMLGLALAGGMFSFAACPTVREKPRSDQRRPTKEPRSDQRREPRSNPRDQLAEPRSDQRREPRSNHEEPPTAHQSEPRSDQQSTPTESHSHHEEPSPAHHSEPRSEQRSTSTESHSNPDEEPPKAHHAEPRSDQRRTTTESHPRREVTDDSPRRATVYPSKAAKGAMLRSRRNSYVMCCPYELNHSFTHKTPTSSGVYSRAELLSLDLHLRDDPASLHLQYLS
ncbi:uncharacterized protein [Drosophila kikkawai]|uniref:Integrase catalytic domain-containing protein n=1 Tax=Drosophila kikkawai TaxID=30033 RepID=A0ABM4GKR3_DROKI